MSDSRISRRLDEKRIEKQGGQKPVVLGAVPNAVDAGMPKCETCRFAFGRMPDPQNVLHEITECRWGPPCLTTIPMGGGMAQLTGWPRQNIKQWCHRHEPVAEPESPVIAP